MAEDSSDFWFWAAPDGSLKTVDRQELTRSLANGRIPAKAMVWRAGWADWVRACQVAELSGSIPAGARSPIVEPLSDERMSHPPPLPTLTNGPIVPVASNAQNDRPRTQLMVDVELDPADLKSNPANPPPPPSRRAPPSTSWVEVKKTQAGLAPIVPVESSPHHEPITGMIGEEEIEIIEAAAGETVKGNAAPKSLPSLDRLAAVVEANKPRPAPVIAINAPAAAPPAAAATPAVAQVAMIPASLANAIVPVSEPDNDAPTRIHPSALRDDAPLPSWGAEVDAMVARAGAAPLPPAPTMKQWPPHAAAETPAPAAAAAYGPAPADDLGYEPPKKSSMLPLLLGGVLVAGLVGAAAVGGLLYFKPWQSEPSASSSARAGAPAAAAAKQAKGPRLAVSKEATRLAPSIVNGVPPYFQALSRSRLAVGIAKNDGVGLGLEIDATTLGAREAFTSAPGNRVVGVVPVGARFVVDREGGALLVPHTLEENVLIGFGPQGYSRLWKGGLEKLWPNVKSTGSTEARVVSIAGVGHAVTFRAAGEIRMGWLEPGGAKKSDLGTISAEGKLGAPNIASNDTSVLVAFAGRPSDDAKWSVELATAKHGEVPARSVKLQLPAGGPGGDAIAPAAAGLPEGRWLLQWTEGGSGDRVVRVQLLDSDLAPVGGALRVSPAGKEAGQGIIAVSGGKAVAFSLVKSDPGYELWGTTLTME